MSMMRRVRTTRVGGISVCGVPCSPNYLTFDAEGRSRFLCGPSFRDVAKRCVDAMDVFHGDTATEHTSRRR